MDRSDNFFSLCKQYNPNINCRRKEVTKKNKFVIKSSEIYSKLFSICDFIDNETLKKHGVLLINKYRKENKKRIQDKDQLVYYIQSVSEEIKKLIPTEEIHKNILNCLNNLLNIFVDIIQEYEHNLSEYTYKLNKFTSFYFYDVLNVDMNLDFLKRINNKLYSKSQSISKVRIPNDYHESTLNKLKESSHQHIATTDIYTQNGNIESIITKKNTSKGNTEDTKNPIIVKTEISGSSKINLQPNEKEHKRKDILKNQIEEFMDKENNEINKCTYNKKNDYVQTYVPIMQEDSTNNNENFLNDYLINNNQKLEFKKYVDLFEKEESNYILETKTKITKISNLMNIFVNKIYEQNENLRMIENIIEESIENVSQGNVYLSKIQNKRNFNSFLFFILIGTAIFLFIFDFFR